MKSTVAVALAGFAVAAQAEYFTLLAARSASPIHLRPINAYQEGFWIGEPTQSYCPEQVGSGCPKGDTTTVAATTESSSISMGVIVPGGQQVYIDPTNGAVKYTIPHSAYTPPGSIYDGWTLTESSNGVNFLSYVDGIIFCPGTDDNTYQMFASGPNTTFGPNCLGASLVASNASEAGAWEYN